MSCVIQVQSRICQPICVLLFSLLVLLLLIAKHRNILNGYDNCVWSDQEQNERLYANAMKKRDRKKNTHFESDLHVGQLVRCLFSPHIIWYTISILSRLYLWLNVNFVEKLYANRLLFKWPHSKNDCNTFRSRLNNVQHFKRSLALTTTKKHHFPLIVQKMKLLLYWNWV